MGCSFCGKSQRAVKKLVHGPRDIAICNECIALCSEIMNEELGEAWDKTPALHEGEIRLDFEPGG